MTDRQRELLKGDMQQVIGRLEREETSVEPYQQDYRRLLNNHGKMVRAALVLIFGRAQESDDARPFGPDSLLVTGAAAIEMLHLATLVHDDVLDGADVRRGQPTVHRIRGNKAAIYLGDLILSRYMEIMASIAPSTAFIREQAGTVCEIVGGELLQESGRGDLTVTRAYYERAIQGKTAALFRLACLTGVKLSASEPEEGLLAAASAFGEHLGMAFQIIDDIGDFDVVHDSGKPKLEDIQDRIYTLPVILGLESDPTFKQVLEADDPLKVLDYLQAHPDLIEGAKAQARSQVSQARQALSCAPMASPVAGLLDRLAAKLAAQA
ncbi:polyprenyl synthetase [Bifidobacterium actinocoloniiforme DSM 22766]|uniref:Polyprenyl synthetase n=1 Tax=Bifidobacterium actinocoloniiforme DSM 22766 TaxID=1437605 RepID=A0A086YYT6_9BIFI|nr:polyprenyl synthetase family protein [Bifidobacterium actinocoloniiforme]KFI39436.1 polyprenyl synthetase [Bifidobacterium actinocoloniiforme DSM 22766]